MDATSLDQTRALIHTVSIFIQNYIRLKAHKQIQSFTYLQYLQSRLNPPGVRLHLKPHPHSLIL